jgi:hypothetical protein
MIGALRQKLQITPLDFRTFRPFQPGGALLGDPAPEGTMDQPPAREERDRLFLTYLKDERKLVLLDGVIDSHEKAKAAADDLRSIDLRDLRVGIPFDRWSEDPYDTPPGLPEYRNVTEWIPGLAQRPRPGFEQAWYAVVDEYLADPADDAKFFAFYDAIDVMTEEDPLSAGADEAGTHWMQAKWKSVQVAQHMFFRAKTTSYPDVWFGGPTPGAAVSPSEPARDRAILRNPIWEVGDVVRVNPLECGSASKCMSLPAFVDVPTDEETRKLQSAAVQASWFWTWWQHDPALVLAGHGIPSVDGDYFLSTMMNRYAIHHAFLVAKGMVEKASLPAGWINAPAADHDRKKDDYNVAGHGLWASPKPFLLTRQLESNRHVTGDPIRQPSHKLMMTNAMRMAFYLMADELSAPGAGVFDKASTTKKLTILKGWFHDGEWDEPQYNAGIDALIDDLLGQVAAAPELKDPKFEFPDVGDIK